MLKKFLGVGAALAVGAFAALVVAARRAPVPATLGPVDGRLRPCPVTPNCVSSQAVREAQRIAPLCIPEGEAPRAAFARLVAQIDARPDARVSVHAGGTDPVPWAHAEFVTRIIGFRDDVELLLDEEARVIHVRSASRIGHSDLGKNRARIEALRAEFEAGGDRR